jgi:hypothetical protein
MALYERVVKRAAINRERAHPGLTLEPSSLPAALLAAACCCSPLAFLMTSLMASLIASLTTPLIPPLIASLISDGLSDGLSDALIRGTHPRASIAGLRHLCSSLYPVLFHGVSVSQQLTHSLGGGGAWDDDDDGCGGGPEGTCLLTGLKLGLKLTFVSLPRSPKMSAFNLDCFRCHGTHSASSHWLTEQCGDKAPKLALPVARTVQTGSAPH